MRAWVVRAPDAVRFAAFEELGFVGIRGGPPAAAVTADLTDLDVPAIAALVAGAGLAPNHAAMLAALARTIAVDDLVLTPEPGRLPDREVLVGRVASDYEHHDPPLGTDLRHVRRVTWQERLPRAILPTGFWQGRVAAVSEAPVEVVEELLGT